MTRARLRLDLPDGSWLAALSRAFPESTVRPSAASDGGSDGDVVVTLAAPAAGPDFGDDDRFAALGRRFSDAGIGVEIVDSGSVPAHALTDAQRDLLSEAIEAGYFDTPRECTLTELADRCGIAPSTASETLRRAEGHVVKRFADRLAIGVDGRSGSEEVPGR